MTYTQEQIEEVKKNTLQELEEAETIVAGLRNYLDTLAVLEAAEKKRDAIAAYAATLEKAGDFMRRACPMIIARDNWDATRKEKP